MRKKKVWRYYCEYCNKSGCSGGHIKKHEERCTMNPNRKCGMCKMVDSEQKEMKELLAVLPDPTNYIIETDFEFTGYIGLREAASDVLPKLRELTNNCPACILAALRQKGIPVPCVQDFNFKSECDAVWADINETNARYGGYY